MTHEKMGQTYSSSKSQSEVQNRFVWKCWVYSQWNNHLIGIRISKTIGFRGLAYFQTHPNSFKKCKRLDVQTRNDPIAIDPPQFVSTSMNFTHTLRPRDHIGALRYGSNLTFLYTEKTLPNFDNIHTIHAGFVDICGRSPLVGCYMAYSMLIRSSHEEGLNPRTNKAASMSPSGATKRVWDSQQMPCLQIRRPQDMERTWHDIAQQLGHIINNIMMANRI